MESRTERKDDEKGKEVIDMEIRFDVKIKGFLCDERVTKNSFIPMETVYGLNEDDSQFKQNGVYGSYEILNTGLLGQGVVNLRDVLAFNVERHSKENKDLDELFTSLGFVRRGIKERRFDEDEHLVSWIERWDRIDHIYKDTLSGNLYLELFQIAESRDYFPYKKFVDNFPDSNLRDKARMEAKAPNDASICEYLFEKINVANSKVYNEYLIRFSIIKMDNEVE